MNSICQDKIIPQGLLQCELSNHHIFSLRVIGIVFNLIIMSWKTKWINRVSSVRLHYNTRKWKIQVSFEIPHEISEIVTLVQLMDSVGNLNHSVSIVCYWVLGSNSKKGIPLTLYSSNLVCSTSEGRVMFAVFVALFHAVRYINNTGKIKVAEYLIAE